MNSFTESIDKKITHSYQQSRGWSDVAHDYDRANRWFNVALWFESKRAERLKAIFGS